MNQNINDLFADSDKRSETSTKLKNKLSQIKQDNKEEETKTQAMALNLNYISLKGFPINPEALSLISLAEAKKLQSVCFYLTDKEMKIGVVDPENLKLREFIDKLSAEKGISAELFLISNLSLSYALKLYDNLPKNIEVKEGVEITEKDLKKYQQKDLSFDKIKDLLKISDISEIIVAIIAVAIQIEASDIHIEAEENDIKVRLRVDGVLHVVSSLDNELWRRIVARIKLISGLKINVSDKPQDGRFTIHLSKEDVDVRVSTIPTKYGESVVMRLLKSSATSLEFDSLGIRGSAFEDLKKQIKRPNGMIVTTGPTGSGKTTTLYAVLKKLNSSENKIITLEDPIEYRLEGISQSQVKKDKNYSFASGLKSILRQDPDIVMVGEIRDLETADTSINAALTGHLVVSTLHTNSAAAAIPRFLAMGVKPFLLAPALNSIIGQRLVRRICPYCKVEDKVDEKKMDKIIKILKAIPENSGFKLNEEDLANIKFYKGQGCDKCYGLGYKGRIGIYEIFSMTPEIEKIILDEKISEYAIQELAQKNGMITMVQDGLLKAKDGITSIAEVLKVAD